MKKTLAAVAIGSLLVAGQAAATGQSAARVEDRVGARAGESSEFAGIPAIGLLAIAGIITLAVYAPLAVVLAGGGFTWLWVAYGGFILARFVTLTLRARSDRWMVLGAR